MEKTDALQTKSFGLPRPLAGALIGIAIFLLILLPLKYLEYDSLILYMLALDLELLGRMVIVILGMTVRFDVTKTVLQLFSITISAIPAWIAGWQIGSYDKATRMRGIVFLVLYICFILVFGTLLSLVGI